MATLKKTEKGFQEQLSLNAGQKYCRMLQEEHSAILVTFIKLPFVIKIFFVYFWVAILQRFYSTIYSTLQDFQQRHLNPFQPNGLAYPYQYATLCFFHVLAATGNIMAKKAHFQF